MNNNDTSAKLWLYSLAFAPIALGHLIVPPISWFRGGEILPEPLGEIFERIYDIAPESFLSERFVLSLILDNARVLKLDWTRVSHIFVHVNYQHLLSNLTAAYQFGLPVHEAFGQAALYAIFVLGGVYASLPSGLYTRQKQSFAKTVKDVISPEPRYIPSFAIEMWDTFAGKVSTVASEFIPQKCCGSSGAVFALMGAQSVLLVRNVIKLFVNVEPPSYPGPARRLNQRTGTVYHDRNLRCRLFNLFVCLLIVFLHMFLRVMIRF
jgi:membrane associated rhomboid family serine protease